MPKGIYTRNNFLQSMNQIPKVVKIGIAVVCEECKGDGCEFCDDRGFRYKGIAEV